MGIGNIIIGMFFLFNPVFSIIDFLPDCIGYYLIARGLSKLADLNIQLNEARTGFLDLLYISIAKIVCIFFLPSVDSTFRLVFTFSFLVLELIFYFKAFPQFFEGMFGVSTRYGEVTVAKASETVTMTWVFLIAKSALTLLPELMCLFEYTESGEIEAYTLLTPANYRVMLYILNVLVISVLGVIWFVMIRKYLTFYKNKAFVDAAQAAYDREITQNNDLITYRTLKTLCAFFSVGAVFAIGIYINNINFIPDAVFALLALIGLLSAKRLTFVKKTVTLCGIFGVLALAQIVFAAVFFSMYNTADSTTGFAGLMMIVVERDMKAKALFSAGAILAVAEAVFLCLFTFAYSRIFLSLTERYALRDTHESKQLEGQNEEMIKELKKSFFFPKAVSVLLILSTAAQQALYFTMPVLWMPTFFISTAYVILTQRAVSAFKTNIENKYMYE